MRASLLSGSLLLMICAIPAPAGAQEREVPYWASLREDEVYMRVGPSVDFPIEWIYRRSGLPVKVVRLNEGWRLVEDPEGTRGWVAARLLDPERAAMVRGQGTTAMRANPDPAAALRWRVEAGVVGQLGRCESRWCRFTVGQRSGWVAQDRLWGAGAP
ncbi:SH3 domain-containing protein [Croceibacterium mercuriale]|uniref:SH3 domain-containing protein n=1 Tax=Croceibacterium mercuriale TaxID=1572751 RepID=UPI001EFF4C3A|nr:SH3 domain-containing protein [Croceibacterium mercuriale]